MGFELVDRYLLGGPVSKPDVVAAILAERSPDPTAAPFYRALEAVGARAADEAFIALRLVLAGRRADDDAVRRLRALAGVARASATGDRAGISSILRRDAVVLGDLPPLVSGASGIGQAAEAAYYRELGC